MRLGAQRGYDEVIETFDGSIGVVGRVMRTGNAELVSDVSLDPDYRAASQMSGAKSACRSRSTE